MPLSTWDGHEDEGLNLSIELSSCPSLSARLVGSLGCIGPTQAQAGAGLAQGEAGAGSDGMASSHSHPFPWLELAPRLLRETVVGCREGCSNTPRMGQLPYPAFGKGGGHEERITGNQPWLSSIWEVGSDPTPAISKLLAPHPS